MTTVVVIAWTDSFDVVVYWCCYALNRSSHWWIFRNPSMSHYHNWSRRWANASSCVVAVAEVQ